MTAQSRNIFNNKRSYFNAYAATRGGLLPGFGPKLNRKTTRLTPASEPHCQGCTKETLLIGSALGGWKTRNFE